VKVVLLKDVAGLGVRGAVVKVAEGYARNYLIPKGLAQEATAGRLKEIARRERVKEQKADRLATQARQMADKLAGLTVRIPVRAGEGGKLFGSVGTKDIAQVLATQHNLEIDRKKLEIKEPIKSLGRFPVLARLHPGVQAKFEVEVVGDDA
jgi:large subunit ribosomal protein L9